MSVEYARKDSSLLAIDLRNPRCAESVADGGRYYIALVAQELLIYTLLAGENAQFACITEVGFEKRKRFPICDGKTWPSLRIVFVFGGAFFLRNRRAEVVE